MSDGSTPTVLTPLSKTTLFLTTAYPKHDKRTQQVQLGVHFEEVSECLQAVDSTDYETVDMIHRARSAVEALARHLKSKEVDAKLVLNHEEMLDSLADQMVTSISVGLSQNYDVIGAFDHVGDSNLSKFENGKAIFTPEGKIAKGENYFKADMSAYLVLNPPIDEAASPTA